MAVAGRIEPTSTTGLSLFTTRLRKYAGLLHRVRAVGDDDAVDVARLSTSLKRAASLSQTSWFIVWLPMLATCSPDISAMFLSCGTALIRSSTENVPDL